jgi:GNAT superfamily N-acetyltransferase
MSQMTDSSSIIVRLARPSDVPGITVCACAAYLHYIERIGRQPGPMLDDYSEVINTRQVLVAERESAILGILVMDTTDEGFYLENVAVMPQARGGGVGRLLLQRAEEEARRQGFDSIYLATHEKMTENQALYLKIGYVLYDHRVTNGYPRVFFRKKLS